MIRFIWQNWWRRKERFILLLIGALIISVGLTYLVGLSETNQATVVDELQQRWSSSYDIVVRPEGTRSSTENKNLLDPNFLSGINGGISMKEYETIKGISAVDIAAPIAMIAEVFYVVELAPFPDQSGIYRLRSDEINDTGSDTLHFADEQYILLNEGHFQPLEEPLNNYMYQQLSTNIDRIYRLFLAAIDPIEEARLIGLDQSILEVGDGRYFDVEDVVTNSPYADVEQTTFPIIINSQAFTDNNVTYTVENIDLIFDEESQEDMLAKIINNGGKEYLDSLEAVDTEVHSYTDDEIYHKLISGIASVDISTGESVYSSDLNETTHLESGVSSLQYSLTNSPFSTRWETAFQLEKELYTPERGNAYESFRQRTSDIDAVAELTYIQPQWIGFYDPSQLNISKDPLNELPMETYRPASATYVLDPQLNPVNPPVEMKPPSTAFANSRGFLSKPPNMLTTIEAAAELSEDGRPISAIRIKVDGVEDLTEESQAKIETVAEEIERETGLITDITLGSSPQPTLVHVPEINDTEELGWVEQPWINIGASISIFRETKIGFSGLVLSVIAVAVIYVWASSLVSLLTRRKEFAVLLSVGWRPSQLSRLLFTESFILGLLVAIIAWMMLGFVYMTEGAAIDPIRFILTGLFGLVVYVLGAIIPAFIARNIAPYEAMRTGEISKTSNRLARTRGIFSMALNHFIGKWKRSILSVVSIALPTSLLAVFLFITFQLQGIMFTTWLGEYVALEVGPVHYTAVIVALLIAILTTAEMMWQNIAERQEEIALLKAVGWRNRHVRVLIWLEGLLSGIFAAIIGLSLAFLMMWALYQELPTEQLRFILSTAGIPLIIGILGTVLPAERAVRISPVQGMAGRYGNRIIVERVMKWGLLLFFTVLIGVFIYMMIQVIPVMQ